MSECIKLYPKNENWYCKKVREAFRRQAEAKNLNKKLAGWWQEMIDACDVLGSTDCAREAIQIFNGKIAAAESKRLAWLKKNGYAKYIK